MADQPQRFVGYDTDTDTEFLLTVFNEDGAVTRELATRRGRDNTQVRWSVPVTLEAVRAS